jgi:two-component system chemotaxis response regulator CheY
MAKILIVDDSATSRRMMRRILEGAGHEVIEADDGLLALERYSLDRPGLVMLDLTMRGMHGLEVLARLRELDPDAQVIVATADVQRPTRELVAAGGARDCLAKPFEPEQILAAVGRALGGA